MRKYMLPTGTILLTVSITVLATLFVEYSVKRIRSKTEKRRYRAIEENIPGIAERLYPLKILQSGRLKQDSIKIFITGQQKMPEEIKNMINAHKKDFEDSLGFYNGTIFGVSKINFDRIGEEETPRITIYGSPVTYFHFLVTNANVELRNDLSEDEKAWLANKTYGSEPQFPIPGFANPLSVEVLLLCDGGKRAVLTRRSGRTVFRGGRVGASVMETVSPVLSEGASGTGEIDIFEVIKRGIKEELGVDRDEIQEDSIRITSLAFDDEVYDYKFTAVATSLLSETELRQRFSIGISKDRYENSELLFFDFPLTVDEIENSAERFSPEAVAVLIMAQALFNDRKNTERK